MACVCVHVHGRSRLHEENVDMNSVVCIVLGLDVSYAILRYISPLLSRPRHASHCVQLYQDVSHHSSHVCDA